MTKLVIFDLDGTLLDTVRDLGNAVNYALSSLGFEGHTMEEYKILVGRGVWNLFRDSLPEVARSEENVRKMGELFMPRYMEHITEFTRPYPGIIQMLNALSSAGIRFALASNKFQEGAELLAGHFFGKYDFVRVLGQKEGLPLKPDPEIVRLAMEALPGTGKEEVVYVGDSGTDMKTGANAGVRTAGVLWGFRGYEELAAFKPWLLASKPSELAEEILSLTFESLKRDNTERYVK